MLLREALDQPQLKLALLTGAEEFGAAGHRVYVLRYRIDRIERLTGRDPTTFEDRVDFFLALRLPR
jgi:hypothetical protein